MIGPPGSPELPTSHVNSAYVRNAQIDILVKVVSGFLNGGYRNFGGFWAFEQTTGARHAG